MCVSAYPRCHRKQFSLGSLDTPVSKWILHGFQKLALPVQGPMFRKHNQALLVCLMFIQFWLYPNSTKSPGFARYPGGTPSCSSCSATGSQSTAIQCASTCVPHWESCFLFPFAAFKFVILTIGKNPVHFPHLTHLKGCSTHDYLINAFFGKTGISSEGGTLSLENAIWNQCILQVCSNNATSIKNK